MIINKKTSNKLKILLLMLPLLSSCGTYEYNFVYTSYKIQYRTLSSDAEKRYDVIEKNIDNSLGEKIVDIHKDLINYKGKKENQNDFLFYSKVNCSFDKAKNTGKSFFRLTKLASLDKKLCSETVVQTRIQS